MKLKHGVKPCQQRWDNPMKLYKSGTGNIRELGLKLS